MSRQRSLGGVERRPVRDQRADAIDSARLQRDDDGRPPRRRQAQFGQPLDQLLDDAGAHAGARDQVATIGALDDERRPPVESVSAVTAEAQALYLFVADLAIEGRPVGRAAFEPQRPRAERQAPDIRLPVRLAPLDSVGRLHTPRVGPRRPLLIVGATELDCG
jgi:hypothetical protein